MAGERFSHLFLPGWGAPAALYAPSLPASWQALEPPSFAASGGSLAEYRRWLDVELRSRGRSLAATARGLLPGRRDDD